VHDDPQDVGPGVAHMLPQRCWFDAHWHELFEQFWPDGQAIAHPPQLLISFVVFTHVFVHRFGYVALLHVATQLAPPSGLQTTPPSVGAAGHVAQVPAQLSVPLGQLHPPSQTPPGSHALPQLVQLFGSFVRLTHVMLDVQSVSPVLHVKPHVGGLPEHFETAFAGGVHLVPQPPQLLTSLVVLTSQPASTSVLQWANPVVHEAMAQWDDVHVAVALGRLHTTPQPPQLFTSFVVFAQLPLHSVGIFPEHIETHFPPEQSIPAAHALSHEPQCIGCERSVSQPSDASLLQSANPALHDAMVHFPIVQLGVAWGVVHTMPQPPQLFGSAAVFTSQPFNGIPSQSV
jgi:hypothetical protein